MNKATLSLTQQQYYDLIALIGSGGKHFRGNKKAAFACVLEANIGIRISDVLTLRLCDIVQDGDRLRLNITERKTGKPRHFTVVPALYQYIQDFCIDNNIGRDDIIIDISARAVQKKIAQAAAELGLTGISTHSFRKFFATSIYENNNHDIRLVQDLLQHAEIKTTQKYIGISSEQIETALRNHLQLPAKSVTQDNS